MFSKNCLPATHECAACGKFGSLLCARCGETYCSLECQMSNWREHRYICMPIPRLLPIRDDIAVQQMPINRMLMPATNATNGFDATDALVGISDYSVQGDSGQSTHEQVKQLSTNLSKMQIEPKVRSVDTKLNDINEVMNTPPTTPIKMNNENARIVKITPKTDENANVSKTISVNTPLATPLKVTVIAQPPPVPQKNQPNFKPSVQVIQARVNVNIIHVENHKTVFVVPTCMADEWKQLIERTNEYANKAEKLPKAPEPGYIVLAKPKLGDSYSRGLVKKVRVASSLAQIEFMEYGFVEVVDFADLKCLSEELVNAPRLVNMVTLKGVPDDLENADEAAALLTTFQEKSTELIVKDLDLIEKSNVSVHFRGTLVDAINFNIINDLVKNVKDIITAEKEQLIELNDIPTEAQEESVRREMEFKGFEGENLELLILDNSFMKIGCFSAVKSSDGKLLTDSDALINASAKELEAGLPFFPHEGESCLAQSADDMRWYRASVQNKINDNTYNLIYIDYGNMEAVPVDRIRELKEEFFFPCITAMCFITGINTEKLTPKVIERLKELIPPYTTIKFDKVVYTGEEAMCQSNQIIDTLKKEGLC